MKIPIVAANWKMHKTIGEAIDLAAEVKRRLADVSGVETVLCPPFTALKSVGDLLGFGSLRLGGNRSVVEPVAGRQEDKGQDQNGHDVVLP